MKTKTVKFDDKTRDHLQQLLNEFASKRAGAVSLWCAQNDIKGKVTLLPDASGLQVAEEEQGETPDGD